MTWSTASATRLWAECSFGKRTRRRRRHRHRGRGDFGASQLRISTRGLLKLSETAPVSPTDPVALAEPSEKDIDLFASLVDPLFPTKAFHGSNRHIYAGRSQ